MIDKDQLKKLRIDYNSNKSLTKDEIQKNPFLQFAQWFQFATDQQIRDVNAFVLSTVNAKNCPTSRVVLMRDFDEQGFVFFTNYLSNKVQDLKFNNAGSINFFWSELERQVRIEGRIEKVTDAESDAYFDSRPKSSQIGAWASPQSNIIPNRDYLDQRVAELEKKYADQKVDRPKHWGGLRLVPEYFEFWQGRANRLHDRFAFQKTEHGWTIDRMAP